MHFLATHQVRFGRSEWDSLCTQGPCGPYGKIPHFGGSLGVAWDLIALTGKWPLWPNRENGWTGQQSGSGFSDQPRVVLGVFAFLDRL
jgi:hypothetical protein